MRKLILCIPGVAPDINPLRLNAIECLAKAIGASWGAQVALVVGYMASPDTPSTPRPPRPGPAPAQQRSPLRALLPLLLLLLLWFGPLFFGGRAGRRIDYSTFLTDVDSGRVSRVEVSPTEIRGTLR